MPEGVGDGFIRVNDPRSPAAIVRVNDPRSLEDWGVLTGLVRWGWGACRIARDVSEARSLGEYSL